MDLILYILAIICVFIGWLASTMHYRGKLRDIQEDLNEALEDLSGSFSSGWVDGWDAAHEIDPVDYEYGQYMYHKIRGNG